MCDCNKECFEEEILLGGCPVCGSPFSTSLDLAKGMVEVLLARQEACNVFILAAAGAIEKEGADVTGIMTEANDMMVSLLNVDETLTGLINFIEEKETDFCEDCLCNGCEFTEECDGTNCVYEDEQVVTENTEEAAKE